MATGGAAGAGAAFFSGNPNLAARFANTSSDIPNGALSIAPAFGAAAALGSVIPVGGVDVVSAGLDVGREALGLNGMPNRSARAFMACCSGVSSVLVSPLDDEVAGAGAAEAEAEDDAGLVAGWAAGADAVIGAVSSGSTYKTVRQNSELGTRWLSRWKDHLPAPLPLNHRRTRCCLAIS